MKQRNQLAVMIEKCLKGKCVNWKSQFGEWSEGNPGFKLLSKRWTQCNIVSSSNISKPGLHKSSFQNDNIRNDSNIVNSIKSSKNSTVNL